MSMYNDIERRPKGETKKDLDTIHRQLRIMLADSPAVIGFSWGLDQKKVVRTHTDKPRRIMESISGNHDGKFLIIWSSSILMLPVHLREESRSKGGGKKSIHFNVRHENIELLLRTVITSENLNATLMTRIHDASK